MRRSILLPCAIGKGEPMCIHEQAFDLWVSTARRAFLRLRNHPGGEIDTNDIGVTAIVAERKPSVHPDFEDAARCASAFMAMSEMGQTGNSRHPALMSAPTQIPDFVAPGHLSRPSAKWHFLTVQGVCARRAGCGSHKGLESPPTVKGTSY
jgi:hypothetical protein